MKDNYEIPNEIKNQIIKDYLIKSYHWAIGLSMFVIGLLLGVLISG